MIAYVTLGTKNIANASEFYDALLAGIGAKRAFDTEGFVAWSTGEDQPMISVVLPHNGESASAGNGTMVALAIKDAETIKALHAKALELGGTNEGDPGVREELYYCAYFRDLDGNKLNLFCMAEG